MYEKQFYLKNRPFVAAPFAPHYYPGRSIHQALNQLKTCVERATGVGLVTGQPGIGKSTLLVMLVELFESQFKIVSLSCSRLEQRAELLQNILFELGEPYRDQSEGELRLSLIDYLRRSPRNPAGILLLVDDAHALSPELLEELHSISNVVKDGVTRCRMILAGNLSLEERLTDPRLESLNQRITARCSLSPFSREESADYVRSQMNRAGAGTRQFFSAEALIRVHQLSDGVPRLINVICDHALLLCASLGSTKVEPRLIEQSWSDIQRLPFGFDSQQTEQSTPASSEHPSWTAIEFGELDIDVAAPPVSREQDDELDQPPQHQGYYWTLTGDHYHSFNENSAASEIERLTREQQELVAQVESLTRENSVDLNFADENSVSEVGAAVAQPAAPPPHFIKNPFEEDFESEEPVLDSTIRYSLRHNRSATELTMLQLATAECWSEEPFSLTDSGLTPLAAQTTEPGWPIPESTSFVQAEEALHGSTTPFPNDENGWNPAHTTSASTPSWFDSPEPQTIRLPQDRPFQAPESSRAEPGSVSPTDDRDMLIVSRVNQYPSAAAEENETDNSEQQPSTGKAIRLDYRDLFERLRHGGDESSQPGAR